MTPPLENKIWELIIKRIEEEKCILIVGPDMTLSDNNKALDELLIEHLDKNSSKRTNYYSDDEFFSFTDDVEKELTLMDIQTFYRGLEPNNLHVKITEIPFHLIVSISPDHILKNLFDGKSLDYTFDFYNKERNPSPLEAPSKQKPLIYNLFGDIETEGSLIFTYDDLFEYLISIFGKFELPQELLKQLLLSRLVLFIGFKFDKWYFKLLLRLLKLHENKINNASEKGKNLMPLIKNFYSEEFKVNFLDYDEIDIINNIHEKCRERNMLRKPANEISRQKTEIFISYGWEGESEKSADLVFTALKDNGFDIKRDKVDLGYKGNIKEFMQGIGKGKYVIVIISDKYLKSENCMFEMLEISRNSSVYNRIFPIILNDARIYKETERIDYINYWDSCITALNEKFKTIANPAGTGQVIEKINQYNDIRRVFDEITDLLRKMNTLTPEIHEDSNFSALITSLDKQIREDNTINHA